MYTIKYSRITAMAFALIIITTTLPAHGQHNFKLLNVLEIYRLLPEDLFFVDPYLGNIKYAIEENEKNYSVVSMAGYTFDITVDIPNGFIHFSDEGTGGGTLFQQIVLFRTIERDPIIGINIGGFNGFYFENRIKFYTPENENWMDVTNEVFPLIVAEQFLSPGFYDNNRKNFGQNPGFFDMVYDLPQYGTTITGTINYGKIKTLLTDKIDLLNGVELTEKQVGFLTNLLGNLRYETVKVNFDKKQGKFYIAEYLGVQQENIENILFDIAGQESSDEGEALYDKENQLMEKLFELPGLIKLGDYINSNSQGKNSMNIILSGLPEDNNGNYYFKVTEDNGTNYVTLVHIYINPETYIITVYDPVTDEMISIEEWQQSSMLPGDH